VYCWLSTMNAPLNLNCQQVNSQLSFLRQKGDIVLCGL
jgi:hypothetical protein